MKKNDTRQPSLFDWKPPPKILAFPQAVRIGPIRRTAGNLLKLEQQEKRSLAYRNKIHADLVRMLTDRQIDNSRAHREADEFMSAVDVELTRLRTMVRLGMEISVGDGQ